jgi:hypothetical protein
MHTLTVSQRQEKEPWFLFSADQSTVLWEMDEIKVLTGVVVLCVSPNYDRYRDPKMKHDMFHDMFVYY